MPVDIGLLVGAGTTIYGAIQKNKAAQAAKNNVQPQYTIPQSEYDNQRLAQSMAGQGMSSAALNAYQQNANQGLSTADDAILRGGGDANAIGNAYQKYNEGIGNMAIYDDKARLANLSNLMNENSRIAAFNDKDYQINKYAPWANRAQAIAQQAAGGQQLIQSGIGTMGQAAMTGAQRLSNNPGNTPTLGQYNSNSGNYNYGTATPNMSDSSTMGMPSMGNNINVDSPASQIYSNAWSSPQGDFMAPATNNGGFLAGFNPQAGQSFDGKMPYVNYFGG